MPPKAPKKTKLSLQEIRKQAQEQQKEQARLQAQKTMAKIREKSPSSKGTKRGASTPIDSKHSPSKKSKKLSKKGTSSTPTPTTTPITPTTATTPKRRRSTRGSTVESTTADKVAPPIREEARETKRQKRGSSGTPKSPSVITWQIAASGDSNDEEEEEGSDDATAAAAASDVDIVTTPTVPTPLLKSRQKRATRHTPTPVKRASRSVGKRTSSRSKVSTPSKTPAPRLDSKRLDLEEEEEMFVDHRMIGSPNSDDEDILPVTAAATRTAKPTTTVQKNKSSATKSTSVGKDLYEQLSKHYNNLMASSGNSATSGGWVVAVVVVVAIIIGTIVGMKGMSLTNDINGTSKLSSVSGIDLERIYFADSGVEVHPGDPIPTIMDIAVGDGNPSDEVSPTRGNRVFMQCPEHGECNGGLFISCEPFCHQQGIECIIGSKSEENSKTEKAAYALRTAMENYVGRWKCRQSIVLPFLMGDLPTTEYMTKRQVDAMFTQATGMNDPIFSDIVLGQLIQSRSSGVVLEDLGTHKAYRLADSTTSTTTTTTTSNIHLPLVCSLWFAGPGNYSVLVVVLVVLIAMYQYKQLNHRTEKVKEYYNEIMDRLKQQSLASDIMNRALPKSLVRDQIFGSMYVEDVVNIQYWKILVDMVEKSENVRIVSRKHHGRDARCWKWEGMVPATTTSTVEYHDENIVDSNNQIQST